MCPLFAAVVDLGAVTVLGRGQMRIGREGGTGGWRLLRLKMLDLSPPATYDSSRPACTSWKSVSVKERKEGTWKSRGWQLPQHYYGYMQECCM